MKNFIARIKGSWLYAWEHIKRFLKNPVKGFKEAWKKFVDNRKSTEEVLNDVVNDPHIQKSLAEFAKTDAGKEMLERVKANKA